MEKPIFNPASEKLIIKISQKTPQSLLVTGESRSGLTTAAKYIALSKNITPTILLPEKDEKVDLEKGIISVELMRQLYDTTKTKTPDERIFIIDYAERMTVQAQNAFLKLLEEPNAGIYFILVSNSVSKLLPTILSRVEKLEIKPITTDQSNELLDQLDVKNPKKRQQLLFIADGLPAELTKLVDDNAYFENRSDMVRDARQFLGGNTYQKLMIANKYKDDRVRAIQLLMDISNILRKNILNSPKVNTIEYMDKLLSAYRRIESNGNIRLNLAKIAF